VERYRHVSKQKTGGGLERHHIVMVRPPRFPRVVMAVQHVLPFDESGGNHLARPRLCQRLCTRPHESSRWLRPRPPEPAKRKVPALLSRCPAASPPPRSCHPAVAP